MALPCRCFRTNRSLLQTRSIAGLTFSNVTHCGYLIRRRPVGFGAMVADASNVMIPDDMLPPSGEDGDEDDDDVQDSAVMMKNPNWRPALRPDSSCSDDSSDDDAARRLDTAT